MKRASEVRKMYGTRRRTYLLECPTFLQHNAREDAECRVVKTCEFKALR